MALSESEIRGNFSPALMPALAPIDSVVPDPQNARRRTRANLEAIKASLARFGFQRPLLVFAFPESQARTVISGNGAFECARALGWTHVPVLAFEGSPDEARAYAIADNRTAELSEWNLPTLGAQAEALRDGFSSLLEALRVDELLPRGLEPEDPQIPDEIDRRAEPGQLWKLGPHRILCGDSRDSDRVAAMCGAADLVMTSPPYNAGIDYESHDDSMPTDQYLELLNAVARTVAAALRPGGFAAWVVGVYPKTRHFEHPILLERNGLRFIREIAWIKPGTSFSLYRRSVAERMARSYVPNYQHEIVWMHCKGDPDKSGRSDPGDRFSGDVWSIPPMAATRDIPTLEDHRGGLAKHRKKLHPAVYPIAIAQGFIVHLAARGETVLDPFGGAGTTLLACERFNRRAFLVEIDPLYVDLTIHRWRQMTGLEPELVGG